jgi:hypothetical protein
MFIHMRKVLALVFVLMALIMSAPAGAQIPPEQMTTTKADGGLVFHHLKRYAPAVDILEEEGPELLDRVEAGLGLEGMPTIDVWVLPTVHDYFELNDHPATAPKWAVGLSFSGKHEIIVAHGGKRPPQEVMYTFAHELAHVAVDHARDGQPVPRWFNEGFSVMMAQEWNAERSEKLARAAAGKTLTPFENLWNSFPSHHLSASLAYDQSFHFVRWLQNEYGDDLWPQVMREIRQGRGFKEALEGETGRSFAALEALWRDSLAESTTVWSILSDETVIFFGAGILFLIAYGIVRRRRKRAFESMEDEDAGEWSYDASRYPLPGQQNADEPPS